MVCAQVCLNTCLGPATVDACCAAMQESLLHNKNGLPLVPAGTDQATTWKQVVGRKGERYAAASNAASPALPCL